MTDLRTEDRAAARAARRAERASQPKKIDRGPRSKQLMRAASTTFIVAGGLLMLDAGLTVVWQEPITLAFTEVQQQGLQNDVEELREDGPTPEEQRALASIGTERARVAFLARSLKERGKSGSGIAKLRIPKIGVDTAVVKGAAPGDLRKGPGLYEETPLPGAGGTTAIAGHRTTFGAPFRKLDQLGRGNRIVVELPYGTFTYRVVSKRIVSPDDVSVVRQARGDRLVLTACHPLFSADQRIVVRAELSNVEPASSSVKS